MGGIAHLKDGHFPGPSIAAAYVGTSYQKRFSELKELVVGGASLIGGYNPATPNSRPQKGAGIARPLFAALAL